MKAYFHRVFAHRGWANQRTLLSVVDCTAAQAEATPILAHLLAAEHVWLSRLRGELPGLPVWPALTLDQCRALLADCNDGWARYISGLPEDAVQVNVAYQNSRGESFRSSVADVLTQVFTHGQYHRGQIAKMVGRAGGEPAITDFIAYARSGNPAAA